jgi:hypothetical protein
MEASLLGPTRHALGYRKESVRQLDYGRPCAQAPGGATMCERTLGLLTYGKEFSWRT